MPSSLFSLSVDSLQSPTNTDDLIFQMARLGVSPSHVPREAKKNNTGHLCPRRASYPTIVLRDIPKFSRSESLCDCSNKTAKLKQQGDLIQSYNIDALFKEFKEMWRKREIMN